MALEIPARVKKWQHLSRKRINLVQRGARDQPTQAAHITRDLNPKPTKNLQPLLHRTPAPRHRRSPNSANPLTSRTGRSLRHSSQPLKT
jgi:hypothetical protein